MAATARTLAQYKGDVTHALGGGIPASDVDQERIINDAGRHLVSMHPWKWLECAPASLNFTQDTAYVAMPSDFRSLVSIESDEDLNADFNLTSIEEIVSLRQNDVNLTSEYYGALVRPVQTSVTTLMPVPRLELYPTPAASVTGALQIVYQRGWTLLDTDTDVPNIPWFMEGLLVSLVRAFALGYEEPEGGTVNQRIMDVTGTRDQPSPLFSAAVTEDGMTQPEYGEMRGGWLEGWPAPQSWNPVSDPS